MIILTTKNNVYHFTTYHFNISLSAAKRYNIRIIHYTMFASSKMSKCDDNNDMLFDRFVHNTTTPMIFH